MKIHNVSGEWRGHYTYRDRPDHGSGFNAFITEAAGQISGSVVDDVSLGRASIAGHFSFPKIEFTKVYSNQGEQTEVIQEGGKKYLLVTNSRHPIYYEGTMTEDGKTMNGTWSITSAETPASGNWFAHRLEEEETDVAEEVSESLLLEE